MAVDQIDRQRLGTLLDGMIRMLAARQHLPMGAIMEQLSAQLGVKPDAIYKYRQGVFVPSDAAVHRLVEIGVAEAGMDRAWANDVLTIANHPDRAGLLARLAPPASQQAAARIRHNLPNRPVNDLQGRDDELRHISARLSPDARDWLIALVGPGGIGKSALALAVAWTVAEGTIADVAGHFDAVIWTSGKRQVLDAWGVAERLGPILRGMDDLYATILDVVGDGSEAGTPSAATMPRDRAERARLAERGLRRAGRALLIVDELDALDDEEQRRVLNFLRELPAPTKAILTARFHEDLPYPITLDALPTALLEDLIGQEAEARQLELSAPERARIAEAAQGNPLAAQWLLAQVAVHGRDLADATQPEAEHQDDLYDYLFGHIFASGQRSAVAPHLIRALLAGQPGGAPLRLIADAAGLDVARCRSALNWMVRLRLARKTEPESYALQPEFSGYLARALAARAGASPRETARRTSARRLTATYSLSPLPSRVPARASAAAHPRFAEPGEQV